MVQESSKRSGALAQGPAARSYGWLQWSDYGVAALLVLQLFLTFVVVPVSAIHPGWYGLMPFGDLVFAAVCAVWLTRRHAVRAALLAAVVVLGAAPLIAHRLGGSLGYAAPFWRELVAGTAFCFNLLVTLLVGLHTFGRGQVTVHRIQGAVLVYLNVAVLFSIAYGLLEAHAPGAIQLAGAPLSAAAPRVQVAEMTYFSLSTITTTGFGDLVPVHPLARSLANLESFFGQLFPATFLARVVALNLAHSTTREPRDED